MEGIRWGGAWWRHWTQVGSVGRLRPEIRNGLGKQRPARCRLVRIVDGLAAGSSPVAAARTGRWPASADYRRRRERGEVSLRGCPPAAKAGNGLNHRDPVRCRLAETTHNAAGRLRTNRRDAESCQRLRMRSGPERMEGFGVHEPIWSWGPNEGPLGSSGGASIWRRGNAPRVRCWENGVWRAGRWAVASSRRRFPVSRPREFLVLDARRSRRPAPGHPIRRKIGADTFS